jgi:hypothetical protein
MYLSLSGSFKETWSQLIFDIRVMNGVKMKFEKQSSKKALILLLSVMIPACTVPGNISTGTNSNKTVKSSEVYNPKEFADLEKEYSAFKTKALTGSYLLKKIQKWMSSTDTGTKLIKELRYAQYKHADLLDDLFDTRQTLYDDMILVNEVSDLLANQSGSSLAQFIISLNPSNSTPQDLNVSVQQTTVSGAANTYVVAIVSGGDGNYSANSDGAGTVNVNGNNEVEYTTTGNTLETVNVTVNDTSGHSGNFSFEVVSVGTSQVISQSVFSIPQGSNETNIASVSGGSSPYTAQVISGTSGGTATIMNNQEIHYTPGPNTGTDTIAVTDGTGIDRTTFTIDVTQALSEITIDNQVGFILSNAGQVTVGTASGGDSNYSATITAGNGNVFMNGSSIQFTPSNSTFGLSGDYNTIHVTDGTGRSQDMAVIVGDLLSVSSGPTLDVFYGDSSETVGTFSGGYSAVHVGHSNSPVGQVSLGTSDIIYDASDSSIANGTDTISVYDETSPSAQSSAFNVNIHRVTLNQTLTIVPKNSGFEPVPSVYTVGTLSGAINGNYTIINQFSSQGPGDGCFGPALFTVDNNMVKFEPGNSETSNHCNVTAIIRDNNDPNTGSTNEVQITVAYNDNGT